MRAIVIPSFGHADVLRMEDVLDPVPGERELLVRVRGSGVNRADILQRRGGYPAPPGAPDRIPGLEYAGEVEALGPGVTRHEVGDRVMGIVAGGGYAERVVVHERIAVPITDGLETVSAAAIPEAFMTAYDAVFLQAGLGADETLLIHAVGSGVGTAAVQLARHHGSHTFGTSRTRHKLERARELGLDVAVDAGSAWSDEILAATGGKGADVILDLVGGPYLAQNQHVLAQRGRHVVVGVPGGPRSEIDLRLLMTRRGRIFGTVLRARPLPEKAELADAFIERVLPSFANGSLVPVVDRILPARDAAAAHRCMESNENFGKIILSWD